MSALPHLLVFLSFLSSGLACIPTVTPDDMYEEEMGTTSVLMTMTQEMTTTGTSTMATSSTTSTSTTTSTTTTVYMCPSGMWVLNEITGRCYIVDTIPQTWNDAQNDGCNFIGANLVSFENQEENDYVYTNVVLPTMPGPGTWWIGLMQPMGSMELSATSTWVDGTPYNYATWNNWGPSGPPPSGATYCITMTVQGINGGRWGYINSCNGPTTQPYICERPATFVG